MDPISSIFKNKVVNIEKLRKFGFKQQGEFFIYSRKLTESGFIMEVKTDSKGEVTAKIIDPEFNEPYMLHLTEAAAGSFKGKVRYQYENILNEIAESCFDSNIFKTEYAKELIAFARETFGDEPEFLWNKFPNNAVWRRKDTGKWYGALLTVSKRKLGINSEETAEIIDLRIIPDNLDALIDNRRYYPGYHMNKKHWYTMILDGSVPLEEICQRIKDSYLLAKK